MHRLGRVERLDSGCDCIPTWCRFVRGAHPGSDYRKPETRATKADRSTDDCAPVRVTETTALRVGVEAGYDRRSGVSLGAPGGHTCVTHSRNQADTRGHRRTRRRSNSSTGGTARTPQDTRGHAVAPVRDREAPGSNPGPPTKNHIQIEDFACSVWPRGSRGGHRFSWS